MRQGSWRLTFAATLAIVLWASAVATAQAGKTIDGYIGDPAGFGALKGQMTNPRGVGVNESNGDVYVVDSTNHRVKRFSSSGAFELAWGRDVTVGGITGFEICTAADTCKTGSAGTGTDAPAGEFDDPQGLAVNNVVGHPQQGHVYVRDRDNRRVQEFDADGNFVRTWGFNVDNTGGTGFEICTVIAQCQQGVSGVLGGQFAANTGTGTGIAIHPTSGDVFVADPGNRRIEQFEADGDFLRLWGWDVVNTGPGDDPADGFEICTTADVCKTGLATAGTDNGRFGASQPQHLAVGTNGIVYANDSNLDQRVMRFDTTQTTAAALLLPALVSAPTGPLVASNSTTGLVVDPTDNHLYVLRDPNVGVQPDQISVQEIDPVTLAVVDTHAQGTGIVGNANGLALNPATGKLYMSASAVQPQPPQVSHGILVFDDDGAAPAVLTISPPTDVGANDATFHGTVNPSGFPTRYRFEFSKNGIDWTAVAPNANLGAGSVDIPVSDSTSALEANSLYRVRIVADRPFGAPSAVSPELSFLTDSPPPTVTTGVTQNRSAFSVELLGRINPNNLPTTYYFEYGRTTAYGSRAPVPDGDAGSGGVERGVVQRIDGLRDNTLYHYRLVATNAEGTTEGADRTFTTRAAADPPDGRAYEMVTPANKNNRITGYAQDGQGTVIPNPGIPSADGEGVMFVLNHGILDPDAGTAFPHERDFVLIRRGQSGWSGKAVNNVESSVGAVGSQSIFGGVSADLQTSSWRHDAYIFPSGSRWGTRVFDDTGGYQGSGWYDWIVDPTLAATLAASVSGDAALIDDTGDQMVRWTAPGLLGSTPAQDPSNLQTAGQALYYQSPPGSGPRDLLNECTGTGASATQIPERDGNGTSVLLSFDPADLLDDDLSTQPCEAGSVTSLRGAVLGGGGGGFGPFATAMSDDGGRVFFTSPDPATTVPDAIPFASPPADGRGSCAEVSGAVPPFTEHVGEDTECPAQLYVRQLDSGGNAVVRWLSQSEVAGQAATVLGQAIFEGASSDGQTVYFRSNTPLVEDDPNGTGAPVPGGVTSGGPSNDSWDLYRYELPSDVDDDPSDGTLTRVSGGPAGIEDPNTNPNATTGTAARYISDDGDRAYFVTGAPIAGADNDAPAGGTTTPGGTPSNATTRNLYLYDDSDDEWKFVAQLPFTNTDTDIDACATRNAISGPGRTEGTSQSMRREPINCVRGTSDGGTIAFETTGALTPDDEDSASDIYVYEAATDELTRASAPPPGVEPYDCDYDSSGTVVAERCNADFGFRGQEGAAIGDRVGLDGYRHFNIAEDGSVYFESRLPLVSDDVNGSHYDTYRWHNGELSLMSPGETDDHAFYSGNSRDGEDVFFWTSQRIDPREIDESDFDVYDARVGGGFPPPPPPVEGCNPLSDGCQGAGGSSGTVDPRTEQPGGGNASPGSRLELTLGRLTSTQRKKAASTGVLALKVRTSGAGLVKARAKGRLGGKRRTLGTASKRVGKAGVMTLKLRLSRSARQALQRGRTLRLELTVSAAGAHTRTTAIRLPGADR